MIPRSLRVPGILLVAALFAALLPSMVRASATSLGHSSPAWTPRLPTHVPFLVRGAHRVEHAAQRVPLHQSDVRFRAESRSAFRNLVISDPHSLNVTWPAQITVDTTTGTDKHWDVQLISGPPGQVVANPAGLDQSGSGAPFGGLHDTPYAQSGASSFFEQNAVFSIAQIVNGSDSNPYYFKVSWLATLFSSDDQAHARLADVKNHFQNAFGASIDDCSDSGYPGTCYDADFTGEGLGVGVPGTYYSYFAFQADNVVGEIIFSADESSVASDGGPELFDDAAAATGQAVINTVIAADSGGGATTPPAATPTATKKPINVPSPPVNTPTPTATPTPRPTNTPVPQPSVKLDGIGIATVGKDKKLHAAKGLKSAQAGYFLAQIEVANAGFNVPAVQITYSYQGKAIATDQMKQVPASLAAASLFRTEQSAQTLTYYDIFGLKKLKKSYKLQAAVDASVGSAHDSGAINFTVKTNCSTKNGKKTCK